MHGGQVLLFLIGTTAVTTVLPLVRRKPIAWSWVVLQSAFALACVAGYVFEPRMGEWLIGPYAVLGFLPLIALRWMMRELAARRYRSAAAFARLARVLHPFGRRSGWLEVIEASRLASEGKLDEAEAVLQRTSALGAESCRIEILRLRGQWDELMRSIEASAADPLDHAYAPLYVRALGETGQLERLIELYLRADAKWATVDPTSEQVASTRLFTAAFLGCPELVTSIASGVARYAAPVRTFWTATALAAAGELERAGALWDELARDPDQRVRAMADRRRTAPPRRAAEVAGRDVAIAKLTAAATDVGTYTARASATHRPDLSYTLAAALVAVQIYVSYRSGRDPQALDDLGMFCSPAVLRGEWWRVGAAMFLHAGWLHLALNVIALVMLGPFVEQFLGRWRFALIYVLAGVGGFAVLLGIEALGWRDPRPVIGASGSIMGLIGASTAIFVRGTVSARSQVASTRLRRMIAIVATQVVFDVMVPNVSMTCHVVGLVIGFVVAIALR